MDHLGDLEIDGSIIFSLFVCVTIDRVWIGELDLLTTYTHHSELQVITALSLISTLYTSLYAKSFPACSVSNSHSLATTSNSGHSSASCPQALLSQPPVRNSCQLSTNWVPGWRPFHTNLIFFSSHVDFQLNWQLVTELSHSPTTYFTSLHSTELLTNLTAARLVSSLHNLGADPTENTSNNPSIVIMAVA
jgi:hypothetical protein